MRPTRPSTPLRVPPRGAAVPRPGPRPPPGRRRPRGAVPAFLRAYGFELTLLGGSIPLGLVLRALLG